jgi:multisubunit Na+/H+ antiporter MnhG subunit
MLAAMAALVGVALIVVQQGLAAGPDEFWMLAWVLAFVLALPGAMLLLPVVSALMRSATRHHTVPSAGETIPHPGHWSR